MIGAGAVATSVAYWLMQWGYCGPWTVVDADSVALHNTNRSVLFFPEDAGWFDGQRRLKSRCLARYLSTLRTVDKWYDEALEIRNDVFDTVLVLANGREVRTRASHRLDPLQFQATTSPIWGAQLHRHIVGVDDCARCRMSEVRASTLTCSEAHLTTDENPNAPDAALPFLSLASGLMLVSALQRLQRGDFGSSALNYWGWNFESTHEMVQSNIRRCTRGCAVRPLPPVVGRIAQDTRWFGKAWLQSAFAPV